MDRAYARASEHRKSGLGNHRHVDQYPVSLAHAQLQHGSRHGLHLGMQFGKGIHLFLSGLGRDGNQRGLVGALQQMPVDGVVA